jgi:hypothetical protein
MIDDLTDSGFTDCKEQADSLHSQPFKEVEFYDGSISELCDLRQHKVDLISVSRLLTPDLQSLR